MKAMEGALRGKQKIDEGAAKALKSMNIPTRSEFKKALTRIEALEQELQAVKAKVKKAPASTARKAAAEEEVAMGRIAVTGTSSFLGSRILRRLVDQRDPDSVVAVDIASPPATLAGVRHRMVDLTLPGADQRLVDVLAGRGGGHRRSRGLLHEPAARRVLLARAGVDRDAAPGGRRGRGRGVGTS